MKGNNNTPDNPAQKNGAAEQRYFSWLPTGLCLQPMPVSVDPHQTHFIAPWPCWCFLVGVWRQPLP
jgi:hypothetical protein